MNATTEFKVRYNAAWATSQEGWTLFRAYPIDRALDAGFLARTKDGEWVSGLVIGGAVVNANFHGAARAAAEAQAQHFARHAI